MGRPAVGMDLTLDRWGDDGSWTTLATGRDRRRRPLPRAHRRPRRSGVGVYRLTFGTGDYFARVGTETFYPVVELTFGVTDPGAHYHVPLLLSPFAFSTYRGS